MGLRDAKINFIIEHATKLYLEKSISEVTIKDIAVETGVGEATIYRYFANKKNIVMRSALNLQQKVYNDFFKLSGNTGFEKLSKFYNSYLDIFRSRPEQYKFINEFDAYMLQEDRSKLDEYSDGLDLFKKEYLEAYVEGLKDGSVRDVGNIELFYYSTTHALLGLCKKLATKIDIVRQDGLFSKDLEIKQLADIILYSIKA